MSKLPAYTGPVEGVLESSDTEILRELLGVVEAAHEKNIRLTKAGIPPKPLWSAINDRLIWKDPQTVLYDWDEVDQIRLAYSLADQLYLVLADEQRNLEVGPGADDFFMAMPSRRAELLQRAYVEISEWDERCDARNEQGHRYNFGQTFRRDFLHDPSDVRKQLLSALSETPEETWVRSWNLALLLTDRCPTLLISEEDEPPIIADGEPEPEILRLVDYWLYLAARFGWVTLGRTPEESIEDEGERVYQITELGYTLLNGKVAEAEERENAELIDGRQPFIIQPSREVIYYRAETDLGDEYLLRRIASLPKETDWNEPVVAYQISEDTLKGAIESGLDPEVIEARIFERSKSDVPDTVSVLVEDILRRRGSVRISTGFTGVELDEATDDEIIENLDEAGFERFGQFVLVPWTRWSDFIRLLGEEPTEGFHYPPTEPLADVSGAKMKLRWPVLPMLSRELLVLIGFTDDILSVEITPEVISVADAEGWPADAMASALKPLTGGKLPSPLAKKKKKKKS